MNERTPRIIALACVIAACGGHGAPQYQGSAPTSVAVFGQCALCHSPVATNMVVTAPDLKCQVCHADQEPGMVGPGHRCIPGEPCTVQPVQSVPSFPGPLHLLHAEAPFGSCAFCHNDKAVNMVPVSSELTCAVCHDNRTPGVYGLGHESRPGPDRVPAFVGPSHLLPQDQALFGSCAYCHNDKAVNMTASGVTVPCTFCHADMLSPGYGPGHRSLPGPEQVQSFPGPAHKLGPEAVYGQCGFCHNATTVTALMSTGHGDLSLACENCHTVLLPNDYGPGHERTPRCAECHAQQQTHQDPAAGTVRECTSCHTPHGSTNIFLINEEIQTPNSGTHALVFDNIMGLADGSFASVARPGTGVCETCHTRTEFYRNDGSGAAHFPYTCFTCHPHAGGFAPN